MSIAELSPGESLRSKGVEQAHVMALAEVEGTLPPILVERTTMCVVDGMHRLLAALLRGRRTIDVEFFDGSPEEGFLRAVEANVVHGLPLTQADRRVAATRIISSHPRMSDREVARASGLGAKTVAMLRASSTASVPQLNTRVGRDGRVRPLNGDEGRRRVGAILAERPDASLREVARLAGVSPATVSDVRNRLSAGRAPYLRTMAEDVAEAEDVEEVDLGPGPDPVTMSMAIESADVLAAASRKGFAPVNPSLVLGTLLRDPSLRHKESGRNLLRLLHQNAMAAQDWMALADAVPTHCRDQVIDLAQHYGKAWHYFAEALNEPL